MRAIIFLLSLTFCYLSAFAQAQCSIANATNTTCPNNSFAISTIQTFKATCFGVIKNVVATPLNSGTIDDLRGTGYFVVCRIKSSTGTVLATSAKTDQWYLGATVTFDLSCSNLSLISGTTYQLEFYESTGTTHLQLFCRSNISEYADGNVIQDGIAATASDLRGWQVNLVSGSLPTTSASATQIPVVSACSGFFTGSNEAIATLQAGTQALGSTTAKVFVQANAPAYNGQPYVRRYYDITPTTNRNTAIATVALYFTQADFDNYNANNGTHPDLPSSSSDAVGKANLRITQQHGTSATGAPGSFAGWAGTGPANVLIDPTDANIVWNATANRWEVTFPVTGFSGFFVHTGTTVLPLQWLRVTGNLTAQNLAWLQWKVEERNVARYEVERSKTGTGFTTIGTINSKGDGTNSYGFTEGASLSGTALYRIKQVDADGRFTYSTIIKLSADNTIAVSLYPNPVKDKLIVSVPASLSNPEVTLSTIDGKRLKSVRVQTTVFTLDMSLYKTGVYLLKFADGHTEKIFKQ